jgi:hypothetical protein
MKTTRWIFGSLLTAALSVAIAGCGDDDSKDDSPNAGKSSPAAGTTARAGAGANAGGAKAGNAGSDPNAAAACPGKVYDGLSDGCRDCTCGVDPQLAPSCQRPCWDFLACSFAAQAGKCATFAAGGAAMRPQFEACTMEECGAELAVPGAEVVSSYRPIIGVCAVSMGDTKAACTDDITKFISELKP